MGKLETGITSKVTQLGHGTKNSKQYESIISLFLVTKDIHECCLDSRGGGWVGALSRSSRHMKLAGKKKGWQ
jgi:hypothetical protein